MPPLSSPSRARFTSSCSACVAAMLLLASCKTAPQAPHAADTTKYTLEDSARFALVDRATDYAVSCTGLMERPLADGHTEVVANIKNRESQRLTIQASCVFRDSGGMAIEETPWQSVTLSENQTVAVRFTAASAQAKKYTVRVRDAH